jgi:hypothetical protein
MQPPEIAKILIIDEPDGPLWSSLSVVFNGFTGICELCKHLYEAVSILSDTPAGVPVIATGMANEFMKENGSFFAFLGKRPNLLCIALDPIDRDYPYPVRQAIWHGQFLVCSSQEEVRQALLWSAQGTCKIKTLSSQPEDAKPIKRNEYQISQEELDALFNP